MWDSPRRSAPRHSRDTAVPTCIGSVVPLDSSSVWRLTAWATASSPYHPSQACTLERTPQLPLMVSVECCFSTLPTGDKPHCSIGIELCASSGSRRWEGFSDFTGELPPVSGWTAPNPIGCCPATVSILIGCIGIRITPTSRL